MSRDILGPDLEGKCSGCDPYESGCLGYEPELIERVIEFYIDDHIPPLKRHIPRRWFNRRAAAFSSLFQDVDWDTFDHNCFLEALVLEICLTWTAERLSRSGDMFDPLIQALYNNRCNGFVLDYSSFPSPIFGTGCYLNGEPDRPLEIMYRTDVKENFAKGVSHCDITLVGKCSYAGCNSYCSTITLDTMPYGAASGAACSEFHMPSSECITERVIYGRVKETSEKGITPLPYECKFYVWEKPSWRKKQNLRQMSFFARMNHIYVLDGDGWSEVLFEEWDGA